MVTDCGSAYVNQYKTNLVPRSRILGPALDADIFKYVNRGFSLIRAFPMVNMGTDGKPGGSEQPKLT